MSKLVITHLKLNKVILTEAGFSDRKYNWRKEICLLC